MKLDGGIDTYSTVMFADLPEEMIEEIEIAKKISNRLNSNNYIEFSTGQSILELCEETKSNRRKNFKCGGSQDV